MPTKSKRGRPIGSEIRENIIQLLYFMKSAHGYEIAESYKQIFPQCSQRVIYYHLQKGFDLGLFKIEKIKKEKGEYSWGDSSERIYYSLSSKAKPNINARVYNYFKNKNKKKKSD